VPSVVSAARSLNGLALYDGTSMSFRDSIAAGVLGATGSGISSR